MKGNNNYPIDFVVLWVDGNDPKWRKEKEKYSPEVNNDARNIRYRDWDNLKYWFRGVEKFAPWVNNVYFITWGHYPKWLNLKHPKLKLINHKDYIPKEYLPTFNANPIELNLNKLEELSEHFVFFNDDMFIIDKVKSTDFFKNGIPCDIGFENAIGTNDIKMYDIYYNDLAIINSKFTKRKIIKNPKWFSLKYGKGLLRGILAAPWRNFIGFYNPHCPQSFLKSTFNEVWGEYQHIMENTSKNKFRSSEDVNQYLIRYWQLCKNQFVPRNINFSKAITLQDSDKEVCNHIFKQKTKLLCINDSVCISDKNFDIFKNDIVSAFDEILPEKSSYEK